MGTLWPKSASFEFDQNGLAAPGAKAYFYEAGTSTPRPVYTTAALSTPHTHPVLADGDGRWPAVFLEFGSYKQELFTDGNTELSSIDDIPNPAPFDESFTLDTTTILNTGDIWCALKNGSRSGAVRLNGRTLGSAASGATERANADCADLYAYIWDNTANAQCPVATGRGATAAADFAANKAITLPDWRMVAPVGFDDMGNTAAGLSVSAPVITGSGILAGSLLGEHVHIAQISEIPAHTHSFSATTSSDNSHTHAISITSGLQTASHTHAFTTDSGGVDHTHNVNDAPSKTGTFTGGDSNGWGGNTSVASSGASAFAHTHTGTTGTETGNHSHLVSGTSGSVAAHSHTVSGTTGSVGSTAAFNLMQRSAPVTWFIKL